MGELDGQVAIVTGAGRLRGIGRATAVSLAKLGADIVVTGTGRDPSTFPDDEKVVGWLDVDSTAEQVRSLGRTALTLTVDVTNSASVDMMVERTLEKFGRVDILINNAAYARGLDRVPTIELDEDLFKKVVDVKIVGTFLCSKSVSAILINQKHGGKIVNISSGAGKSGDANMLAYSAACFAQVAMTQTLAKELGPFGINVNCVCPGLVDTSRVDDMGRGQVWKDYTKTVPLNRLGTDEELGEFASYLCTNAASWIHGQSINIDGGELMNH